MIATLIFGGTVRRIVASAALAFALLAGLPLSPAARGDADPASDVLLGENVFYPYSPPVSASLQAALNRQVSAAHRGHFPLKVALIASPIDLGAIPSFFGKPAQYATFLDQEISFGNGKVPLLVVMRNGYGTAGLSTAASSAAQALSAPRAGTANGLAEAAIASVPKLATASGYALRGSGSSAGSSGGGAAIPLAILVGVCMALAVGILALRRRGPPRTGRRRGARPVRPRR